MFPLDFPYAILKENAHEGDWVLDPFCGRGTTNYAARTLGLNSIGLDSNIVAVAIAQAKISNTSPQGIINAAEEILGDVSTPSCIPEGEFWEYAYHPEVLSILCRLRDGLLQTCNTDDRIALRAILLGSLHGPRGKKQQSYFSNQMPRTYAAKPNYSVKYWKEKELLPQPVDILKIIEMKAERYFALETQPGNGVIFKHDSRDHSAFGNFPAQVRWIITSPPYYGMRTYLTDQWLRMWFLGGPSEINYTREGQLSHFTPSEFASDLRKVWRNASSVATPDAKLIFRFGAINDRKADPLVLAKLSIENSGWRITSIEPAGSASLGKRQAKTFLSKESKPIEEFDVWTERSPDANCE